MVAHVRHRVEIQGAMALQEVLAVLLGEELDMLLVLPWSVWVHCRRVDMASAHAVLDVLSSCLLVHVVGMQALFVCWFTQGREGETCASLCSPRPWLFSAFSPDLPRIDFPRMHRGLTQQFPAICKADMAPIRRTSGGLRDLTRTGT